VTYTRYRIDTIDSPDDEHMVARNMQSIKITYTERTVRQVGYLQEGLKFLHYLSTCRLSRSDL